MTLSQPRVQPHADCSPIEPQSGVRAQEVFKHIDEDCGGTIDTDEFTQWWMEQQRMKAFTGKGGQLFNMFEASAMMSTLARLSGRSDDGADGVMTGDLEAIASGTLLPKKVRIHVCGRVAQEGDGLVGEQERMIHVRGVGVEGWDGTEEGTGVYESDEALEEIFEVRF